MTDIAFDDPELARRADGMTGSQLDRLPFGAPLLDADGPWSPTTRSKRRSPASITGSPSPTPSSPSLRPAWITRTSAGRFEQRIAEGNPRMDFDYDSDTDPRAQNIRVRMQKSARTELYWVFIERL